MVAFCLGQPCVHLRGILRKFSSVPITDDFIAEVSSKSNQSLKNAMQYLAGPLLLLFVNFAPLPLPPAALANAVSRPLSKLKWHGVSESIAQPPCQSCWAPAGAIRSGRCPFACACLSAVAHSFCCKLLLRRHPSSSCPDASRPPSWVRRPQHSVAQVETLRSPLVAVRLDLHRFPGACVSIPCERKAFGLCHSRLLRCAYCLQIFAPTWSSPSRSRRFRCSRSSSVTS